MIEYTREERIRELKALRAELIAAKERINSEEDEGESSNASIASIRKDYILTEDEQHTKENNQGLAKDELYSQYSDEQYSDSNDEHEKVLVRTMKRR